MDVRLAPRRACSCGWRSGGLRRGLCYDDLSDDCGDADVERRITAVVQSVSTDAVEFLLGRTPQHRQPREWIEVLGTDFCQPCRHRRLWARVPKLNL